MSLFQTAQAFLMRNRVRIFDLGFVLALIGVATLFTFEADIFVNEARDSVEKLKFELNELLVLATLVMAGVLYYVWRRAVEHKRENVRRLQAEQEVLKLALHDPLTSLPNRRHFDESLKAALKTVPTAPEAHAIFFFDLNGFKKVNDIHGHPVGDQLLIHVSARLLRAKREGDLVARLGGDEFAVIARNIAGSEGAASLARRMTECFDSPFILDGVRHQIGTAIGIALTPHDGVEGAELLRKADVALYRAKVEKKTAVRFFEAGMDAHLHERDELERALQDSVNDDALFLRFKPSVNASDGAITGFEVLPRWRHPTLGDLGSDRLLPIAEDAGLLASVTQILFRQACRAASTWPPKVRLAYNFPGALLSDTTIGLRILAALSEAGLSPTRLDLEVDEGALVREAESGQALISLLRKAGISIVADHFGTGYANLQNLQQLQIDRIKIDPSFVSAMLDDRRAAVMVRALISIGQGLDVGVAADGVMTLDQQAALAAQGCEVSQGDLVGGPVDEAEAEALVAETDFAGTMLA